MPDKLKSIEPLTSVQEREGENAYNQFKYFEYGIVITTPEMARSLAKQTSKELEETAGMSIIVSEVDFKNQDSVTNFLEYWEKNEGLLKHLHDGTLVPKDIQKYGFTNYPVFLFINPTNLGYFDEIALGSKEKSEEALSVLYNVCKFGRVNVVMTPDIFEKPGTLWPNVPDAYKGAVSDPFDVSNKLALQKYLFERSGIKDLGLEERVENCRNILTPTKESLEKLIVS